VSEFKQEEVNIYKIEKAATTLFGQIQTSLLEFFGFGLSEVVDEKSLIRASKEQYKKEGITLRTGRPHEKELLTVTGYVKFSRCMLFPPKGSQGMELLLKKTGKTTVVPLDDWLGISGLPFKAKATPSAMLEVAQYAAELLSYKSAAKYIAKSSMKASLNHETVRKITDVIGSIVMLNDKNKSDEIFALMDKGALDLDRPTKKKDGVLYIETDGAMLPTKKDGEKGVFWRENKLAMAFSSDHMRLRKKKHKDDDDRYDLDKREYACYLGGVDVFQRLMFALAIRNGYGKYKRTVILSDGATWIKNMKENFYRDAIRILDFRHLCEHIYDFAKLYFDKNEDKYKPWAEMAKKEFRNGRHAKILPEIEKMQAKLSSDDPKAKLFNYVKSNMDGIDYASYKKMGLYIGSGHIESGNKSVAQERMKRPGMRWKDDSANNLLALRAKLKSDLWEEDVALPVLRHYKMLS
jgi:hypothetical protein